MLELGCFISLLLDGPSYFPDHVQVRITLRYSNVAVGNSLLYINGGFSIARFDYRRVCELE